MLDRVGEWVEDMAENHPVPTYVTGVLVAICVFVALGLGVEAVFPDAPPGVIKARTEAAAIEWAKGMGYEDPRIVCDDVGTWENDGRGVRCTLATERGGRLQALRCSAYMGTSAACRLEVTPP